MNCKPGDICIVNQGDYFGWQVVVLSAPPVIGERFRLPNNGDFNKAVTPEHWIIESLSGAVMVGRSDGSRKLTHIGTVHDSKLTPIGNKSADVVSAVEAA